MGPFLLWPTMMVDKQQQPAQQKASAGPVMNLKKKYSFINRYDNGGSTYAMATVMPFDDPLQRIVEDEEMDSSIPRREYSLCVASLKRLLPFLESRFHDIVRDDFKALATTKDIENPLIRNQRVKTLKILTLDTLKGFLDPGEFKTSGETGSNGSITSEESAGKDQRQIEETNYARMGRIFHDFRLEIDFLNASELQSLYEHVIEEWGQTNAGTHGE